MPAGTTSTGEIGASCSGMMAFFVSLAWGAGRFDERTAALSRTGPRLTIAIA